VHAEVGHGGEEGVTQPLVPAVQGAAVLAADVHLDGRYVVGELHLVDAVGVAYQVEPSGRSAAVRAVVTAT
jgi:hypothetical protein